MHKIGIIGFGNMGQAIAYQLKSDHQVYCFDSDTTKTSSSGVGVVGNIADLIEKVEAVVLAVKPQDFESILKEIKACPHLLDKLFISIAAGITTRYIENALGVVRVIRVMPNMAIQVGQGFSCVCHGKYTTTEDFDFAEAIFSYMGMTLKVEEEKMNVVTAISGSGPGFYFDIIESNPENYRSNPEKILKDFIMYLMEAAEKNGFSHEEAIFLSTGSGIAAEGLLSKTKLSPAELKKKITSKGGTTEAGLEALHKTGSILEAVHAATKRAAELAKE
ncbi:MAG: pyrroline-5-carboxylate reductase [Candidatus Omnitrophica bacterium]|jgi:pyrroline-5-carboxylate reductase|nr:pyrroline-5-carboxylate reductase [Candidatus Omnitrophota bacterium]